MVEPLPPTALADLKATIPMPPLHVGSGGGRGSRQDCEIVVVRRERERSKLDPSLSPPSISIRQTYSLFRGDLTREGEDKEGTSVTQS